MPLACAPLGMMYIGNDVGRAEHPKAPGSNQPIAMSHTPESLSKV